MSKKQLFGTNGVRGVVGKDMTPKLVMSIGMALGSMRKGTIAVGRDTRTSGPSLVNAVKAGLLATGCDVVDCGVLPIPALQYIVKHQFDAGAMITASHNPRNYNGVKVIEPDGTEMADEQAIEIEKRIFDENYTISDWEDVGEEISAPHLVNSYISAIVCSLPEGIGKGISVVVDAGCGAAYRTTAQILQELGCHVTTINAQPDGSFPARTPEPSEEGLAPLAELVKATGAAFGVAHDGDADRAVFIDDKGRFVEENKEFALIADEICKNGNGLIVTPVSSSGLIENIAEKNNCSVVYTPVGSIYVAREMIKRIKNQENVLFGGEGNGGLIYPKHQFCRDGGMTAATMVSLLASTKKSLSELVDKLPKSYMVKHKIHTDKAVELLNALKEQYSDEKINLSDGIRIDRKNCWALIRPSGTEPFVRVYSESADFKVAEEFYEELLLKIKEITGDDVLIE